MDQFTIAWTQQQHLEHLESFLRIIGGRLRTCSGTTACPGANLLQSASEAECVQCGIHVSGEELAQLSEESAEDSDNPRLARLRRGYCARNGCNSYYYRINFADLPGVEWNRVLESTSDLALAQRAEDTPAASVSWVGAIDVRWMTGSFALLMLIALGVLARHWYLGGTIPFVSEPEQFEVDRSGVEEFHSVVQF